MVKIEDYADSTVVITIEGGDMERSVMETNLAKELLDFIYEKREQTWLTEQATLIANDEPETDEDKEE